MICTAGSRCCALPRRRPAGLTRISGRVLQDGRVTVNGERAQPSLRLKSGDVLQLDGKVRPLALFSTSMACVHIIAMQYIMAIP